MVSDKTVERLKKIKEEENKKSIDDKICLDEETKKKIRVDNLLEEINDDGVGLLQNYLGNIKRFYKINPFFYSDNKIFWLWSNNRKCYEMVDETGILVAISKYLKFYGKLLTTSIKSTYLEGFKQVGRALEPKTAPKTWVQFKDKIIDVKTKEIFKPTPQYFLTNPIPYKLGDSEKTPVIDKLIIEWVGKKYLPTIKQIIAYCCLSDYPIHRFFCFVGSGRNGKSQLLKLIKKFIGLNNITSAELDKLSSSNMRFETSKLYNKLVCVLGETNFGTMQNTSILKKLTGGDLIDMEIKNKNPFNTENYATILINSNSLPTSEDTSDGFYRRWIIIDFPNEFSEGKDIVNTIPEKEYNNLARMVVNTLPTLYETGKFINEGTIPDRKSNYIMNSNPLPFFINKFCNVDYDNPDCYEKCNEVYKAYTIFLRNNKKRKVGRKEFYSSLENEGIFKERTTRQYMTTYYFIGVELKKEWRLLINEKNKQITPNKNKKEKKQTIKTPSKKINMEEFKQEIKELDNIKPRDVLFHLERLGDNGEMDIETLKEELDINDKYISYLKQKGYIVEFKSGFVKIL